MKVATLICIVIFSFSISINLLAQNVSEQGFLTASSNFNKQRFNVVVISEAGVGSLITVGLQYLWYKKFPRSHFHFFNDNDEWLNMDKVGHATTTYNIAAFQYNMMRWSGVNKTSSLWIGVGTALAYMSMIEISDGFSAQWGFSPGDMIANITGTALFAAQQETWGQQRILMQFSFHKSIYAQYNPGELGNNFPQRMIKDYNGQSYWLSFNLSSFMGKTNFPKWIMADVGYGASGMTGAVTNPSVVDGKPIPSFTRERKLFLGVSGAFTTNHSIPYPSWVNIFKVPSPVLEWNITNSKVVFKPFYF
jgi:Predicted periplasmic lipoprotein (DUF2279)